jgi:hypothetical protein
MRVVCVFVTWAAATAFGADAWDLGRLLKRPPPPPLPPPPLTLASLPGRIRDGYSTHVLRLDEAEHVAADRPLVCSVAADAIFCQGTALSIMLFSGLFYFTLVRTRFVARVKRLQRQNPRAFISEGCAVSHAPTPASGDRGTGTAERMLPGVTVVLPCKGVHAQSYNNWKSQASARALPASPVDPVPFAWSPAGALRPEA